MPKDPDCPGEEAVPADILGDLFTEDNALSLWSIEDDVANLHLVLAALAAGRDRLANLDYVLFDMDLVDSLALDMKTSEGKTLLKEANSNWHRDLLRLSASGLAGLAERIFQEGQTWRVPQKDVKDILNVRIQDGSIDKASLSANLLEKLSAD